MTDSEFLREPGGPEEYSSEGGEEKDLAMCSRIAEKLKKIAAAAFEGHVGFIRPELLDRRLSDGDHDAPRPEGWCAASRWPGDARAARVTRRHGDQHAGLPIAVTCCRTAPAGGQGVCAP
ncbi:hypothetical protein OH781_04600 [Streptomyces sp. NBC_01550]|uniref:hypothetical protein n=1 Tax=unclassified Streptomyces TaxID=2593676 RepID=UPI0036C47E5D